MRDSTSSSDSPAGVAEGPNGGRSQLSGKYLTFNLAGEEFGIEILKVREIIGLMAVTPVPGAPSAIRGVINLRGKVIPVMELRRKFGLEQVEDNDRNCIIVVEVTGDEGQVVDTGLLVDGVSEVLNINAEEIEPAPEFGHSVDTSYILGMAKAGQTVKILLNIEKVVLDGKYALEGQEQPSSANDDQSPR